MRLIRQRAWKPIIFVVFMLVGSLLVSAQQTTPEQSSEAAETGTISGTVIDSQTGNVIRTATVAVEGAQYSVQTDIDGKYVLKLPAGKYMLIVTADDYFEQPIEGVEVRARRVNYIDTILVPTNVLSEEVVVTADRVQTATLKSTMLERQMSQSILETIPIEEISKNQDSDAGDVLERVPGASIIDDNIYVRGLGERYSTTQVNGSMIPSTNPEKKVVSLDLFPSSLINKVSTLKSFTPDQPGDFSGALVKIETMEFPAEFILKYSAGIGFNTNVSLKEHLGYPGSRLDWIGFGYDDRRLPEIIPDERVVKKSAITGDGFTPEELQEFGQSFHNEWEPRTYDTAFPNLSQSITAGGTFGGFGTIVSLTYGHNNARVFETLNSYVTSGGDLIPWNTFVNDKNTRTVKLGFVGNVSYKLNQSHKLLWKNFYTRDSSDETRFLDGYSSSQDSDERNLRLRYLQETLWTTQAGGEHYFDLFTNSMLEWRMAYSRSTRGEPDLRENIYRSQEGNDDWYFASSEGQSGYRQFSDQQDRILEPGLDFSMFLIRGGMSATIKVGGLYQNRERDFSARRFLFRIKDRTIDLRQSPEELFTKDNIAPGAIELNEVTRFTDTFDATQDIYAGYGMADVIFTPQWRVLGGVRYEKSEISLSTFDPYKPTQEPISTKLDNSDPLPAASLIYSPRSDMNFRGGYSRTVNRPEFREISPFSFTDISGRNTLIGNPDLQQSKIDNFDVRWEWFPTGEDMYAASFFSKRFDQPIERVTYWAAGYVTSFANIDNASSLGIELEARKNLGFVSQRLENFSIYSNYSRISSNATIGDITGLILTSTERPLQGQAKYLFNANLEYANPKLDLNLRLLYNLVGSRISEVGALGLPDIYEQPNHFLDFSFVHRFGGLQPMQLKFSIKNILNRAIRELQDDQLYFGYKLGRSFGISISYDLM